MNDPDDLLRHFEKDQAVAGAEHTATIVASYYAKLIAQSVPSTLAARLTLLLQYKLFWSDTPSSSFEGL